MQTLTQHFCCKTMPYQPLLFLQRDPVCASMIPLGLKPETQLCCLWPHFHSDSSEMCSHTLRLTGVEMLIPPSPCIHCTGVSTMPCPAYPCFAAATRDGATTPLPQFHLPYGIAEQNAQNHLILKFSGGEWELTCSALIHPTVLVAAGAQQTLMRQQRQTFCQRWQR